MRPTKPLNERIKIAEQWRASGLSAREFAEKFGINVYTLREWAALYAKKEKYPSSEPPEARTMPLSSNNGFIEIVTGVNQESHKAEKAEPIELLLKDGTRLLIPGQFDVETLRKVVKALEER